MLVEQRAAAGGGPAPTTSWPNWVISPNWGWWSVTQRPLSSGDRLVDQPGPHDRRAQLALDEPPTVPTLNTSLAAAGAEVVEAAQRRRR